MNYGNILVWGLAVLFWICVYMFGFFQTVVWYIIGASIGGLWIRLSGRG